MMKNNFCKRTDIVAEAKSQASALNLMLKGLEMVIQIPDKYLKQPPEAIKENYTTDHHHY